ncbi:MAG: leucyl/phenylalanyl-tRNA--protein transferase [bacterium]
MVLNFPPVESADESGLLAMGGDLDVETLLLAYCSGIFPWPYENEPILWFAPPLRAIIKFADFRIPSRLQRYLRQAKFQWQVDRDFAAVIKACAQSKRRKGQQGTWITDEIIQAYIEFHNYGYAHSFEAYNENGELVAGLYGVLIGKYFAGESMFYQETHASKFVLIETVNYLKKKGVTWMDVQIISPLLESFGAIEIPRADFMAELKKAIRYPVNEK